MECPNEPICLVIQAHAISAVLSKFRCYCGLREILLNYGNSFTRLSIGVKFGITKIVMGYSFQTYTSLLLCYFRVYRYIASKRGHDFWDTLYQLA